MVRIGFFWGGFFGVFIAFFGCWGDGFVCCVFISLFLEFFVCLFGDSQIKQTKLAENSIQSRGSIRIVFHSMYFVCYTLR